MQPAQAPSPEPRRLRIASRQPARDKRYMTGDGHRVGGQIGFRPESAQAAGGRRCGPCATMGAMTRPRTQPPDVVKPVSVSLTPELVDRLDAAARRQQVSRSLLVREFVQAGLDNLDAEPVEPPRSPVQVY